MHQILLLKASSSSHLCSRRGRNSVVTKYEKIFYPLGCFAEHPLQAALSLSVCLAPNNMVTPCSTLIQVEPHATMHLELEVPTMPDLQYPLTGRTSYNCTLLRMLVPPFDLLAVPSHGSNLMQPHFRGIHEAARASLQYPLTGRTSCNPWSASSMYPTAGSLAVPSHGSNLMQRIVLHHRIACYLSCSTLSRVEPHATARTVKLMQRFKALAVPSHGSNLMQPVLWKASAHGMRNEIF